jgi:DNA-binding MarR family transcriptional regulator
MRCPRKPSTAEDYALNRDITDTLTGLVKHAAAISHSIAERLGLSPSDLLALFKLDDGITMKELARRMGCDASFVTMVADELEKHGLARREQSERDRRVKNLVLTPEGVAAKEEMMRELAARMPWSSALSYTERQSFLSLLRKMDAAGTFEESVLPGGDAVTTGAAMPS